MSLERRRIPLLPVVPRAGGRLHSGNLGCKVTTFGKQHRSCKHPIHIPLVEWHCGKRTCHVRLVICVELQQGSIVWVRCDSSRSILIHVFASYHHLL
ncbi:hypothetical protein EV363DRAFT_1400282 [Boletus edulis]|nr:hypothetical protein EV363DRAFT_1400282 [Boletus edulis]